MQNSGRISAAISVVDNVLEHNGPAKEALRNWGRNARFAGAKDRAFVSGLVLDVLRHRSILAQDMDSLSGRALVLAALVRVWGWPLSQVIESCQGEHAAARLDSDETGKLIDITPDEDSPQGPFHVVANIPEWIEPYVRRAFGDEAQIEMQAMLKRAPVDVRVNLLKSNRDKVLKALKPLNPVSVPELTGTVSLPVPDAPERSGNPSHLPAFSRGWFEIQDRGSQIAAAASGVQGGQQVLDYCAGGGGKSLAMSSWMDNRGQIHAYDMSSRRLSAFVPRLHRSGGHNVQLFTPGSEVSMESLLGRMDTVLVDAPCTGTGTWRRRPDTKWRLSEKALARRIATQDEILAASALYVRPGGHLLYITCSFLMEENEDRIEVFLKNHPEFESVVLTPQRFVPGALSEMGMQRLRTIIQPGGGLRLTPWSFDSDAFFVALLKRRST